jgi:hypothetical protein
METVRVTSPPNMMHSSSTMSGNTLVLDPTFPVLLSPTDFSRAIDTFVSEQAQQSTQKMHEAIKVTGDVNWGSGDKSVDEMDCLAHSNGYNRLASRWSSPLSKGPGHQQ